ncbi:MAG: dienelactone hydrolase family protein, partial [Rhodoblastus sp.]
MSQPADIKGLWTPPPLSRRGFMTTSSAAMAGYALAAGPVRAEAIRTDAAGLTTGEAKVAVAGGDMPVFFARPEKAANPPIIIVASEIFGVHEYIREVARRLARLGAFAVAPGYYFRAGVDLASQTDFSKIMPVVNAKPDAELIADLDATAVWAKGQGGDAARLGMIGFCRGGRAVWEYCALGSPPPRAGVAFYGPLEDNAGQKAIWPNSPMDLAGEMKAPVLGLYGEADQGILVMQVEEMEEKLKKAGKTARFKIYPGAPHG